MTSGSSAAVRRDRCPGALLAELVGLLVALAICQLVSPAFGQGIEAYRLGPGDRLKISVFGHPEVSGEFEVDGAGNLAYPLLGQVQAQGRTASELENDIRVRLDKDFIVNPRVAIEVLVYRPFYIYGEINKPGSYPYVVGLTVRRAVAISGGFTRRARHEPVTLVRETVAGTKEMSVDLDVPVLPGDVIEIERRLF